MGVGEMMALRPRRGFESKKNSKLPPCKWWQRAGARALAIEMNGKVIGGAGIGLGVGYKWGAAKIELRVEAVTEFTYDNRSMQSTLGPSFSGIAAFQAGNYGFSEGGTLTEFFRTDFSEGVFDPKTEFIPSHWKESSFEGMKSGSSAIDQDSFKLNVTAGAVKAGFEINYGRIANDMNSILRESYFCDPTL